MKLALVADTFPPMRTSGAVQLRDLARELAEQGHDVVIFIPMPWGKLRWEAETREGYTVVRLRAPATKDMSYLRRTMNEFLLPFAMYRSFLVSPFSQQRFGGVAWYSPTIFLGPFIWRFKRRNDCSGYLILRDIFPEWAADMGLMNRGMAFRVFKAVANFQYSVANIIGVQTPGNLDYFSRAMNRSKRRVEVLHNWLRPLNLSKCSIDLQSTILRNRKIFVYAGNMGVAQGMDLLLELVDRLRNLSDVGFVFVGRGSDVERLKTEAANRKLTNVLFFDEIDPDEIPALYAQCHAGLIGLDRRHKSHNIPGKFISYMYSGLPVLAAINPNNDLARIVQDNGVGSVSTSGSIDELVAKAQEFLHIVETDREISKRCVALAETQFSADAIARQIVAGLENA